MGTWFMEMAGPVLLHFLVTELVAAVSGTMLDASSRVLLSSLLVMPAVLYMYRSDEKKMLQSAAGGGADTAPRNGRTGKNSKGGERSDFESAKQGPGYLRQVLICALCFAAGGLLNLGWSGLLTFLEIQKHFSNAAQEALLSGQLAIQLVSMGIFAPLTEELIFRGLLYRRMKRLLPAGQSVVLSSLLFAVYHGNMIQIVFAFPMALVLALLYEKGGRLRYPILFHMGCNLTAVAVSCLFG